MKLALLLLTALPAFASDHIDGPVTTKHRVGDITDLYAFPTPGKPGSLSLVLNAYPLVGVSGHFSDKVDYTFVVRKAERQEGADSGVATSEEVRITCKFQTPEETANHRVACQSSNGLNAENKYAEVSERHQGDDFRVFAGMRSDPFFFNSDFAESLSNKGKLIPPANSNVMDYTNVMSVAIEVDANKLFKNPGMIAVGAESVTHDNGAERMLDRVGRPEVTNVGMVTHGEPDLRDQHNKEHIFGINPERLAQYKQQFVRNIGFYDQADGKANWNEKDRLKMAAIMADDFLLVDLSKPCNGDNFFEIEQAIIDGKPHATCGGRRPTDDIMDSYFSLYVSGPHGAAVHDGVDKPQYPISAGFPYLAEADTSLWARTKTFLAKKKLGIQDTNDLTGMPAPNHAILGVETPAETAPLEDTKNAE